MILVPKICAYCGAKMPLAKHANKYCSKQCSMRAVNYKAGRAVDMTPAQHPTSGPILALVWAIAGVSAGIGAAATALFFVLGA